MNNINEKQNKDASIEKLVAQRCLYSEAKKISYAVLFVAALIAIVFPVIGENFPAWKNTLAFFAVLYLLIEVFIFEKNKSIKKITAAKIQELFDVDVLELRWNSIVAGSKPDSEIIGSYLNKLSGEEKKELYNWYSSKVSQLPIQIARLICQRSNIWWDSKLRRKFAFTLIFLLTILLLFFSWFYKDSSLSEVSISFLPFAPLVKIIIQMISLHLKSADRLDQLKKNLDLLLEKALKNLSQEDNDVEVRSIQDEIFRHRSTTQPIPNFFYILFRKKYENLMGFKAEKCVEEFLSN